MTDNRSEVHLHCFYNKRIEKDKQLTEDETTERTVVIYRRTRININTQKNWPCMWNRARGEELVLKRRTNKCRHM